VSESKSEPTVSVEIPESAAAAVADFLERRSRNVSTGFCFGVALPDFGGPKCWAVFEMIGHKWVILSEVDRPKQAAE
jgi:hypothetical protein